MAEVSVKNLDEIKLHLKNELKPVKERIVTAIESIKIPKAPDSVKVSNLGDVLEALKKLQDSIASIEFNPTINVSAPEVYVPEQKAPVVTVTPTPVTVTPTPVTVSPADVFIDIQGILEALEPLKYLSDRAESPLSVRLSDGKSFMKAIQTLTKNQERQMTVFSNNSGMTSDEFKTVTRNVDDVMAKYRIADKDDDASPNYYGFLDPRGNWYILKETVSAGGDTYRYARGGSDYATNWTNRAALSYGYMNAVGF